MLRIIICSVIGGSIGFVIGFILGVALNVDTPNDLSIPIVIGLAVSLIASGCGALAGWLSLAFSPPDKEQLRQAADYDDSPPSAH